MSDLEKRELRLKRDWIGAWVRIRRDLEFTDGSCIPAGAVLTVDGHYRGRFHVAGPACPHCWVKQWARHLDPADLEYLGHDPDDDE